MPGFYNRIVLVGNVTRDPEMRFIASGSGVVKFTLAVNRRTKNGDEVMFIDIVAWEKLAETCNTYLKKGMSVLVEGRLTIRSYDDKDGNKRKSTEVVIDGMQMLDRKSNSDSGGGGGEGNHSPQYSNSNSNSNNNSHNNSHSGGSSAGNFDDAAIEDEIPF